jgi:hypothetical protein
MHGTVESGHVREPAALTGSAPEVLPGGFEPPSPPSDGGILFPWTMGARSVRVESNHHAEATALRAAEPTTCSTHGWGAQPGSNRPAQGHNLVSDPAESGHQQSAKESDPRLGGVNAALSH